jgi:hypothetical protein
MSQLFSWKTLAPVNAATFKPGDTIAFAGGQTFAGNLTFTAASAGTSASPITITSYGTGTATISATSGAYALSVKDAGGYSINNINFVGLGGASATSQDGIYFDNDLATNQKMDSVTISNVNVSGFSDCGILIGSETGTAGFSNFSITHSVLHDNGNGGIESYASYNTPATAVNNAHTNVYVGYNQVYNNLGFAGTSSNSGNGILLGGVSGGTIEYNVSYNNGTNNTAVGGPVGIWAYAATNITIQYNESYSNHSNSSADGDGFDLDGDVTNSVMQYNYSHNNDGAGFLVCTFDSNATSDNVVRFNISENDGRKNATGAIFLYAGVNNTEIYNNVVYLNAAVSQNAVNLSSWSGTNATFRNNIFISASSGPLITGAANSGLLFQGNDYWTGGASLAITLGGSTYTTLAQLQGAGYEMLNAAPVGLSVNPALTNAGGGGTIGTIGQLSTLNAYTLTIGSPLIGTGLDLFTNFAVSVGTRDFYGNTLPASGFNIGAWK